MSFSDDPRLSLWERERARQLAGLPPPGWKNPPKRHHYVPQMYLRRFSQELGRKREPRIACIDTSKDRELATVFAVNNAAVEGQCYTPETDDPRKASEIEHCMGLFETAAGYAFANFDRSGQDYFPDRVDRQNLSLFIALQLLRGHDTVDRAEEMLTQVTRRILKLAARNPEIVRRCVENEGGGDGDEEALSSEALEEAAQSIGMAPHRNSVLAGMLKNTPDVAECIQQRHWLVGRTKRPLLTRDRPVLLQRDPVEDAWRGVGVQNAGVIVFVLDRHRVLLMRQPGARGRERVVDLGDDIAKEVNAGVANQAGRWIFFHPQDEPFAGMSFGGKVGAVFIR